MDEERYRWLLRHIETCPTCDVYREDNSASECPALAAFWSPEAAMPDPAAHEVQRAGGDMLPGFENVAAKPEERRGYPS